MSEETRQKVIFYIWDNYKTSTKEMSITSISKDLDIPLATVLDIVLKERMRGKLKKHNNFLIRKRLKSY